MGGGGFDTACGDTRLDSREGHLLEEDGVSVNIQALVGISIPVIVRHGDTHATVSLSGLAFQPATQPDEAPALDLLLNRSGNRGVQGEFKVDWIPRWDVPAPLTARMAGPSTRKSMP